jgi:hypothetical protein
MYPIDRFVRRLAIYAGAALAVTSLTALTIRVSQREIRSSIDDVHDDVTQLRYEVHARSVMDSVRFERTIEVVELVAAALVEPDGSNEQKEAVTELRRRRHITAVPIGGLP